MRVLKGAAAGAVLAMAGWLGGPGQAQAQWQGAYTANGLVECNSYDNRPQVCPIDNRSGRVRVYRQISTTPCIEGQTYIVRRGAIEVARGCRAIFAVDTGGWGGNWGESGDYRTVMCESRDGRRRFCPMDTRNGVRLERELSSSPCIRGRSWGYDRNGVWVDRGCRGEFASFGGWGGSGGTGGGYEDELAGFPHRVDCMSLNGGRNFCTIPNWQNVRLHRQLSRERCVRGQTWGIQAGGIWVDGGCRGLFVSP
jgi:hypothetical protein